VLCRAPPNTALDIGAADSRRGRGTRGAHHTDQQSRTMTTDARHHVDRQHGLPSQADDLPEVPF
jgi:hypothetical protein